MSQNYQTSILNCGKLHVNFTILVYSPTKITSIFIPFLNSRIFALDTLNVRHISTSALVDLLT